jgi:hypothetical protein
MTMLASRSPQETYRRIDLDARVTGGDPRELVALSFEQLIGALGTSVTASERGDNALKSRSLTQALSAIVALEMGIAGDHAVTGALRHFYEAARRTVLDSAIRFDRDALAGLRQDFIDIARAMQAAPGKMD